MLITHNMKNKKLLLGIAWAWLTCMSANAEVKLPAFFSDGMVMHRRCKRRVETCFIHPLCRRPLHDHF